MRDFSKVKRVVIKIGTNTLAGDDGPDRRYVRRIAGQIAGLTERGIQVVLVTSGAIGMGARALGLAGPVTDMKMRQGCAAVGMPLLMQEYRSAFARHGIMVAQVLLTAEVLDNRKTYLNLRNSVETLLKLNTIPVMNENDCVSTEEIGTAFGDNDRLSALAASKIDADLLIMLTDIDALYNSDPRTDPGAQRVSVVYEINSDIVSFAGPSGSVHATGGMRTKINAARIAADAGCRIVLAHGRARNVIGRIMAGADIGTVFLPKRKLSNRLRWILNSAAAGTIMLDDGAVKALRNKKSLLPSGIVDVRGNFPAKSVVMLNDCGKAFTNFSSSELRSIAGMHSTDIRKTLGSKRRDVVAIPEDIVFFDI